MHSTLEFLVNHGYVVLLVWVFLEQAGLPLPSIPLLLAASVGAPLFASRVVLEYYRLLRSPKPAAQSTSDAELA